MWTPGIEPELEVLQTSALPIELNPQECAHALTRRQRELNPSLPVDNRMLFPLSYDGKIRHLIVKERSCHGKDSNLHPQPSEGRARPIELPQRHRAMHRGGLEPASLRLKDGGSGH
jgi:hypothetical protein